MTDKTNYTPWIIGIAIGGLLVYIFLRRNTQPATLSPNPANSINLIDINSIGTNLNALNQRINLIEQKIDRLQPISIPTLQIPNEQLQNLIPSPEMVYKNKMHIVRDQNGDIVDIERNAKITNK